MSEYAKIKVERFRKQFQRQYGDGHYFFACHAAFPIAFSVDLLYQLWANFKDVPEGALEKAESPFLRKSETINQLAVSDLLQSDLCRRTDRDLFEMETDVRTYLLHQLEDYFSGTRLDNLARFSFQYVDKRINDPYYKAFRDTQRWVSMARLAPEKAGEQLAAYYNLMIDKDDAAELARLDGLLEALALMDARFKDLRAFSKAIRANYTDQSKEEKLATARTSLKNVVRIRSGMAGKAGGLKVNLTENLKSQQFEFKKEIGGEADLLEYRIEQSNEQGGLSLDLSGLRLTSIPREVFDRKELETFDLSNNELKELPPDIGRFENLRQLILDDNQIVAIPEVLRNLKLLEHISVKNNRIDFLPVWIVDFPNLSTLDLRGNTIENIRKDKLLFKEKNDFEILNEYFYPKGIVYSQPMIMILMADPWERSAVQRALEPAVDRGVLHIEVPENGKPWQLFRLFRQFRDQLCFLHINGSGVEDNFSYQFGSPPKTYSLSLHAWEGIVDAANNGKLCFISGGTGKRVVKDMLRRAFEACIYTTDFEANEGSTDAFVVSFYGRLANGGTLGEAYNLASDLGNTPPQQKYQQSSMSSYGSRFTIDVRDTSVMDWRMIEESIPPSFYSLMEMKKWIEERLLRGGPGAVFTPLKEMIAPYADASKYLSELQDQWEQLQSERERRAFYEPEESAMRVFLRTLSVADLREGLIEFPQSAEGSQEYAQSEEEEQQYEVEEGHSWFLGIGISKHMQLPDIRNAVNDVRDIQRILEERYDVNREHTIMLLDGEASKKNILSVFRDISNRVSSSDQLIIYYGGHSRFDSRTEYTSFLPFDASPEDLSSHIVEYELLELIKDMKATNVLILVDGNFPVKHLEARKLEKTAYDIPRSRWKLSSGYDYERVSDGLFKGNGPFATTIMEVLGGNQEKTLPMEDFAVQVVKKYAGLAGPSQLPDFQPLFLAGHEGGEYVFRLKKRTTQ